MHDLRANQNPDQYQVKDAMGQIATANLRCIQCDSGCLMRARKIL